MDESGRPSYSEEQYHKWFDELTPFFKLGLTYYRCGKKRSPCKGVRLPYLTEKDIENHLMPALESIEIDQDTWKKAREYVIELNEPEKTKLQGQIRILNAQIEAEKRMQVGIGRDFIEKKIDENEHNRLLKDSYSKEALLRKTVVKCENIIHELTELMYGFLDDIKYITLRFRKASALNKRELVSIFCENLLWDYKTLRWDWLNPYYILVKQPKELSVLPRLDSN